MNQRVRAAKLEIRRAAERIDPRTARMQWSYVEVCDPYGLYDDLPEEAHCVGREYFLVDPRAGIWVLESDVRELHPQIPVDEWEDLMRAASARDETPDPFPIFHRYGQPAPRAE